MNKLKPPMENVECMPEEMGELQQGVGDYKEESHGNWKKNPRKSDEGSSVSSTQLREEAVSLKVDRNDQN